MICALLFLLGLGAQTLHQEVGQGATWIPDLRLVGLAVLLLRSEREQMPWWISAWILGVAGPSFEPLGRWLIVAGATAFGVLPWRPAVRVGHPMPVIVTISTAFLLWQAVGFLGRWLGADTPSLGWMSLLTTAIGAVVFQMVWLGLGRLIPRLDRGPTDARFLRETSLAPRRARVRSR